MSVTSIPILLRAEVADQLPADPRERELVFELGLREWRVRQALAAFERGQGTLAYAAERAGVPLREMIPLAYAHGLEPRVEPGLLEKERLTLDEAADL